MWSGLCPGGAYLVEAAEPALPFLTETARVAGVPVLIELLDLFLQFAACSRPPGSAWPSGGEWVNRVYAGLPQQRQWFQELCPHEDRDVTEFAALILPFL